MREIKCRAWDETNKTMIYPDFPKNLRGLTSADILKRWSPEWIMQYTGLKDKNGKEIYEGDIVELYGYFNSEVFWNKEFGFWSVWTNPIKDKVMDELLGNVLDTAKIIGNIYENPELLEGKE